MQNVRKRGRKLQAVPVAPEGMPVALQAAATPQPLGKGKPKIGHLEVLLQQEVSVCRADRDRHACVTRRATADTTAVAARSHTRPRGLSTTHMIAACPPKPCRSMDQGCQPRGGLAK